MSSKEAFAATKEAMAQFKVTPRLPLARALDPLPACLTEEPERLLERLLASAELSTAPRPAEEQLEEAPVEAALNDEDRDDDTLAAAPENPPELQDFVPLLGGGGGETEYPREDIYGKDAKPVLAPPRLLKLMMLSKLDEEGNGSAALTEELSEVGDEALALRDAGGWTALHIAAGRGAKWLTETLLRGPKVVVDARDQFGWTPLLVAAQNSQAATAKALLNAGADPTAKTSQLHNALHIVSDIGAGDLLALLLRTFPRDEIDARDEQGLTALSRAALRGRAECAGRLVEAGADQTPPTEEDGDTALHLAARLGHPDVVRRLLGHQPSPIHAQNKRGMTPLMTACAYGQVEVAKELVSAGSDLELADERGGYTAIHWAVHNGSIAIVTELIKHGSRVNFPDGGQSCLQVASLKGHLEVGKLLVKAGADVHYVDSEGFSALSCAAQEGQREFLEFLLSQPCTGDEVLRRMRCAGGALQLAALRGRLPIVEALLDSAVVTLDFSSATGSQAIHTAAQGGHEDVVEYLLGKGADPDTVDGQGVTPLMFAAEFGRCSCLRALLEGGASSELVTSFGTALHVAVQYGQVEAAAALLGHTPKQLLESRNGDGFTVLHIAAMRGDLELFRLLQRSGASLGARLEGGGTCLHVAAQEGHKAIAGFFLQYEEGRYLIDVQARKGFTALMLAVRNGHGAIAEVLLAMGASPSALNDDGESAVHAAALSSSLEMLKLLLEQKGVNINGKNNEGLSAIMQASVLGTAEAVQSLIAAGANVDLADKCGQTAAHHAAAAGALASLESLIAAGASVRSTDEDGNTCLHHASFKDKFDVVSALLTKHGLSPDVQNTDGECPLHLAASQGHSQTARVLLSLGADANSESKHKSTPLSLAAEQGQLETVKVLLSFGADPSVRDADGDRPSDCAKAKGHTDVARLLEMSAEEPGAQASGGQTKVRSWMRDLQE